MKVARCFRFFRITLILVVALNAACAAEQVCVPIERCEVIGDSDDVDCVWIGPKDGPKAYTEHPDGLQIRSDDVTDADLKFLKSAVTLECHEYVFRVQILEERLRVSIAGLERRGGYRGFTFKRNEDGQWELDGGGFLVTP